MLIPSLFLPMKNLHVKKSKHGRGVFAGKNFARREKILSFEGPYLQGEELPIPYDSVSDHYVQIAANAYLGPSGNVDDFVNHSCDPNTGIHIDGQNADLVAIRDIAEGEEITWDYSTTMDDEEDDWEMACLCGKIGCRIRIRDFRHLPIALQKKYIAIGIV